MDPSMELSQSPLVIFGQDHVDTTRAETLVQCLTNKIKEKRFKLQKLIGFNEDKKKRNELMEKEKLQLTITLSNIEHENCVREQQLQTEQLRIKELQFNIQMLDDHNNSIKRDCMNEERKYEQEKLLLINKFENVKQQWTDIFKPQYEQSKVYQYLKQGDLAYNTFIERKEALLNSQRLAYKDYLKHREEFRHESKLQSSILSIAKHFVSRHNQLMTMENMKKKLIELENKQKQLIDSKLDKMKAWENVYRQPVKRDLLNFCLQTNIDQVLTLSFNQIQQDIWSQPMTPVVAPILTPQNEQLELVLEKQMNNKQSVTSQLPTSILNIDETGTEVVVPSPIHILASTIVVGPSTAKNISLQSNRTSVLHLTTAIDDDDDDDDELFSKSHQKAHTAQMQQMIINDVPTSTQSFTISKTSSNSNKDVNEAPLEVESNSLGDPMTPIIDNQSSESISISPTDTTTTTTNNNNNNKIHPTVTFHLPPAIFNNRTSPSVATSIQPQVTSNDVHQMLLTFSPDPPSDNEEQPQIMEDNSEQFQQQQGQRSTFPISSSIESMACTDNGYVNFNYNFTFDDSKTGDDTTVNAGSFTSPINFGNWSNLGSPMTTNADDQFPAFLQQTNSVNDGINTAFSFASFNFGGLSSGETPNNASFGSFFFGDGASQINTEQAHEIKNI